MNKSTSVLIITMLLLGTAAYLYLNPEIIDDDLDIDLDINLVDEDECDYC